MNEEIERWRQRRDSLKRQIELMEAGKLKSFEGPALRIDTTAESLEIAKFSLESVEWWLAHHGGGDDA